MRITKFGHACVLIEDGGARVLLDPGTYTAGFEDLRDLSAVLITHSHPDHVDQDRLLQLLEHNPTAKVVADDTTAAALRERGVDALTAHDGDRLDLELEVEVSGVRHTPIHADIPAVPNVAYFVARTFFHPGDSFTMPDGPVPVLGLPTGGPWLKLGEAIDYLRAVRPAIAIPIHESVLARPAASIQYFEKLAAEGTTVRALADGEWIDV